MTMLQCGLEVECHHHEVATGGQTEIDLKFDTLVNSADNMMLYKYIVQERGQPVRQDGDLHAQAALPGQRLRHAHPPSLWKGGKPLFAGDGYAGLSQMALWYIGGLIKHGPALSAIIAPTTNSYKRLVPGFRSAGEPGVLAAQPLGGVPHPDVLGDRRKPSALSSVRRTRAAIRTWRSPP